MANREEQIPIVKEEIIYGNKPNRKSTQTIGINMSKAMANDWRNMRTPCTFPKANTARSFSSNGSISKKETDPGREVIHRPSPTHVVLWLPLGVSVVVGRNRNALRLFLRPALRQSPH
jgi:hypothetical protein